MKERKYTGVEIEGTNGKVAFIKYQNSIIVIMNAELSKISEIFMGSMETFKNAIPNEQTIECGCGKISFEGEYANVQRYSTIAIYKEELKNAFQIIFETKENCGTCGVAPGELHNQGCDLEKCPLCKDNRQLISCNCQGIICRHQKWKNIKGTWMPPNKDRVPWSG
ncbi:hypothetical protein ACFL23_00645 [Patescibacteria group bacterium]